MVLWLTILTGVANLGLGFIVYRKNKKSITNQLFAILTLIFAWWALANYFSLYSQTIKATLFWMRAVMFITSPLGPALFLFIYAFPHEKIKINKVFLAFLVTLTLITALLSWTPYMFSGISLVRGAYPIRGPAVLLHGFLVLGTVLLSFLVLLKKYLRSYGLERVQIRYLLLGVILTFSLQAITNFLLVVFLGLTRFMVLGPLFSLILIGFIAYSIVKHRFMDIRLAMVKTVAYFLLIVAFAVMYAYNLFVWVVYVAKFADPRQEVLFSTLLALLMAFSFQPLRQFFEKITNKIFYKDRYDSNKLLMDLGRIMASTIKLEDLASLVLKEILGQIKITRGAILLVRDHKIFPVRMVGYSTPLKLNEKEVGVLLAEKDKTHKEVFVFEELEEGKIKQALRKIDATMAIPLEVKGKKIGLLVLGEKSSGDIFSREDIRLLEIIASEMAIALENARAYEEIKRFTITLKEEVKRATEKLRNANKRLKELDKLKDEFVSIASHELRTPMTAIKSYLWLALYKNKTPVKGKLKRNLERAYTSTERLIRLIQEMLTVSRIEGKRLELKFERFDLYTVAKQVYEELKIKADEKKIKFSLEPKRAELSIKADKDRIRDVLQNIIGNALKFTPENGQIKITFKKKNGMIETSVSDTGPGISKDDLPRLFQKFGRIGHSYTKTKESSGTGLGLYITKQIVTLHHGKIWVSSKKGEGSTFTFSLPEEKQGTPRR